MIGVGVALLVVGIILLFMLPWVGIVLGVAGIVLSVLYFAGFGRRPRPGEQHADRSI
jgi:4-hydroxybenzoate polyprenyltransferase